MEIKEYNPNSHYKDIFNLWQEVGWLKNESIDKKGLKLFLRGSDNLVAIVDNKLEGCLTSFDCEINYLNQKLKFQGLAGIIVSPFYRKKGLASKMIVESIERAAIRGKAVSGLIMFEQGYYDRFGFALGTYDNVVSFNPNNLLVEYPSDFPARIYYEDWQSMHFANLHRNCNHGNIIVLNKEIMQAISCWSSNKNIGFGYFNDDKLTHYIWTNIAHLAKGEIYIDWSVFNSIEEFKNLLSVIKTLEDQVHLAKLVEPVGIQVQDFLNKPVISKPFPSNNFNITAKAIWQIRILDLEKCISKTTIPSFEFHFNLDLQDPIEKHLNANSSWNGIGGKYNIFIGEKSFVEKGHITSLPTLQCSVNGFSKIWLGINPASFLAATNQLSGPVKPIKKLDSVFRFTPKPQLIGFPRIPRNLFD